MNKKNIIYIIVAIVAVAIITVGTIMVLNSINNKEPADAKVTPTVQTATDLRDQAETARKNDDKAKAKTLLLEAQEQIKELPKNDENKAASVDVEAQLFMLEHADTTKK